MWHRQKIKQLLYWLIVAMLLVGYSQSSFAQSTTRVYVVYQERGSSHRRIVSTLQQDASAERAYEIFYIRLGEMETLDEIAAPAEDSSILIVPLGTNVTEQLLATELPYPLLSAAIPRLSFRLLKERFDLSQNQNESKWFSAIYLDQPLARNLNFIQTLLPDARRIGVALGNENLFLESQLRTEIDRRDLQLSLGKVSGRDQLINTLDQVLDQSDVYMGIVDPLVFSSTSAKNVLQTAYRRRVPLIGISPAYARAGALGSIYSSPAQIGTQLLESIDALVKNDLQQPPLPQSPSLFSIAINYQVAEALGLQLDQEDLLVERLKILELQRTEAASDD